MATRPPSPDVMGLVGLRLKTSAAPKLPSGPAVAGGAEPVGGVEHDRDAGCAAELLDRLGRARRAEHVGADEQRRAVEPAAAASATSSWQVAGSHSANRGTAPAQRAAWAVAEKVKLGMTAAVPGRDSAWSTSMRPAVHDDDRDHVGHAEPGGGLGLELRGPAARW